MSTVKFAITYTVKNEARLLPAALEYHRKIGCSKFYIFWDGTTDNAPELINDDPDVVARNTFRPEELVDVPSWISDIVYVWDTDMDVRKRINTYHAAIAAKEAGIDWLVAIDPDELLFVGEEDQLSENYFTNFLGRVPENFDQVLLRNLESVPCQTLSEKPFEDTTFFLNRFPVTETVWRYSRAILNRIGRSPKLVASYDYLFYYFRFLGALPRKFYNPMTGEKILAGYFIGYSSSKSCVRLSEFENFNFNTHYWLKFKRKPKNIYIGYVLHYDLLDAQYFINKFRQRQPGIILSIFHLRYTLANLARDLPDNLVIKFFEESFIIKEPNKVRDLKKKNILLEIKTAANFFRNSSIN